MKEDKLFDFFGKSRMKINTKETIDTIENSVYLELKPLGFRKHGRTLHRFVDDDISQLINFQCGQAYRDETHLMWVNVGIRVPECMVRSFNSDEPIKKYYRDYDCNIRSCLGTVKGKKASCYDLRGDVEKIIDDILEQITQHVLPVFEVLNSRGAILKERKNHPNFDTLNSRMILLEEAMIYGRRGDVEMAAECFNQYYKKCLCSKDPHIPHIEYLKKLAVKLGISLEN